MQLALAVHLAEAEALEGSDVKELFVVGSAGEETFEALGAGGIDESAKQARPEAAASQMRSDPGTKDEPASSFGLNRVARLLELREQQLADDLAPFIEEQAAEIGAAPTRGALAAAVRL